MTRLYVTVGLPGSGKSTLYTNCYSERASVYLSSDELRIELFGDVNDQAHNQEVFETMFRRTIDALRAGKSVYYDATNVSAKKRAALLTQISAAVKVPFEKIAVVVAPTCDIILEQNSSRDRVVPQPVILRMLKNFQMPEKWEGWDDIRIYGTVDNKYGMRDYVEKLRQNSHDNPHHRLSVGDHMLEAFNYLLENYPESCPEVVSAALYHDLGKGLTMTHTDAKGNPSDIAHFYGHENVGAYLFLSWSLGYPLEDRFTIVSLIQHHMDYFKGEGYMKKLRRKFDSDFMLKLELLHEADLAAH